MIRGRAVGVCGTDIEIIEGGYGDAPPGEDHLILGHESLGEVVESTPGSGFAVGDHVAKACVHGMHMLRRTDVRIETALITGAGPIGLLAALVARQAGLETHVVDIVEGGPKPDLVREIGAHYHAGSRRISTFRPKSSSSAPASAPCCEPPGRSPHRAQSSR